MEPDDPSPGTAPELEERVVLETGLHGVVFAGAGFAAVVAAAFAVAAHLLLGAGFAICALGLATIAALRRRAFRLTLTTTRIAMQYGVATREQTDVPLARLEALSARQGVLGRMLDFGTVTVTETGGSRSSFSSVARPGAFRYAVLRQLDSMQNQTTQVHARATDGRDEAASPNE